MCMKIKDRVQLLGWKFIMSILFLSVVPSASWAAQYVLPLDGSEVIGEMQTIVVEKPESLASLGIRYGVGFHEMVEANPYINPRKAKIGEVVSIPTQYVLPSKREGIVINLAELRLYFFHPNGQEVYTFPLGIGRRGWSTPTANTKVIAKSKDPIWFVPKSIREHTWVTKGKILPKKVMPGPKNPLGKFALHLGVPGYLIHGTNKPSSIGKRVSSGCMRMLPDDIESLFQMVDVKTPVHIINEPHKVGRKGRQLYLESHEPLSDAESFATRDDLVDVVTRVAEYGEIDWYLANQIADERMGIPKPIQ